jgi:hypothetical protein
MKIKQNLNMAEVVYANNSASTQYWKDEFQKLILEVPDLTRMQLVPHDSSYLFANTKDDIRHAKNNNAGFEKVMRLVLAMQKLIAAKESDKTLLSKLLKNQRLVATV